MNCTTLFTNQRYLQLLFSLGMSNQIINNFGVEFLHINVPLKESPRAYNYNILFKALCFYFPLKQWIKLIQLPWDRHFCKFPTRYCQTKIKRKRIFPNRFQASGYWMIFRYVMFLTSIIDFLVANCSWLLIKMKHLTFLYCIISPNVIYRRDAKSSGSDTIS